MSIVAPLIGWKLNGCDGNTHSFPFYSLTFLKFGWNHSTCPPSELAQSLWHREVSQSRPNVSSCWLKVKAFTFCLIPSIERSHSHHVCLWVWAFAVQCSAVHTRILHKSAILLDLIQGYQHPTHTHYHIRVKTVLGINHHWCPLVDGVEGSLRIVQSNRRDTISKQTDLIGRHDKMANCKGSPPPHVLPNLVPPTSQLSLIIQQLQTKWKQAHALSKKHFQTTAS